MRKLGTLLAVALAACNSAPPAGQVQVTFYYRGMPAPSVPIWFGDPQSGAVVAQGTTDSSGTWSAGVPDGASVSAAAPILADPPAWQIYTVLGTHGGDVLTIGDSRPTFTPAALGDLQLTLPGAFAGADHYAVTAGCGTSNGSDPTQPQLLTLDDQCVGSDGKVAVLAQVIDATGAPIAYSVAAAINPPAVGDQASLTMGAWRTDWAKLALTVAGVPTDASAVQAQLQVEHQGVSFDPIDATVKGPAAGSSVQQTLQFADGLATRVVWKQSLLYGASQPPSSVQLVERDSGDQPPPAADSFDPATDALPRVFSQAGSVGPNGSPIVTWQTAGDLAGADTQVILAEWVNPNQSHLRWILIGPPVAGTSLTFPEMAKALDSARGVVDVAVTPAIYAIDADYFAGYDSVRRGTGLADILGGLPPPSGAHIRVSTAGMLRF